MRINIITQVIIVFNTDTRTFREADVLRRFAIFAKAVSKGGVKRTGTVVRNLEGEERRRGVVRESEAALETPGFHSGDQGASSKILSAAATSCCNCPST